MSVAPQEPGQPTSLRVCLQQAGLLLLGALVPAIATGFVTRPNWHAEPTGRDEIALFDALAIRPHVLWIDARPAADYSREHIPDALPLNEDEWSKLVPTVLHEWSPGRTVIVYCNSTGCDASGHVAKRLRAAGLSPVHTLHGGWDSWLKR